MNKKETIIRKIKRAIKQLLGKDVSYRLQIECSSTFIGSDYGGWDICPTSINSSSIIYSFGVGEDISFDLGLIEKYGVQVLAFDPSPKSIDWVKDQDTPKEFQLYEYGIADYDGEAEFFPPDNPDHVSHTMLKKNTKASVGIGVNVKRLNTIMKELGHSKIDIFKMDIEGAEYAVIDDILDSNVQISQILVEFHHRFKNVGISKTKTAVSNLNNHGYKIFAISSSGEEYSFIKANTNP